MLKTRIIIFEGVDASGKDYMHKAFSKYTDFHYFGMTRGFVSAIVYTKLYSRRFNLGGHHRLAKRFMPIFQPLIVYCYATDEVLMNRLMARKETVPSIVQFRKTDELFKQVLKEYVPAKNLVRIDTSSNPDYTKEPKYFKRIFKALRKLDKEEYYGIQRQAGRDRRAAESDGYFAGNEHGEHRH